MGILEKSLLSEFQNDGNLSHKLPNFDILDFPHRLDSLLNSAEYGVLADYLNFFSNIDNLESVMTNENIETVYYFCKAMRRELPLILDKIEKGEMIDFLSFLIKVFFVTWDSRISTIPTSINKRAVEFSYSIDFEKLRKDYPLAAKSNDHLLKNKTFLEEVKSKFLSDYSSKNRNFYENVVNQAKDTKDPKQLFKDVIDTLSDIETGENLVELYVNDYLIKGICDRFYIDNEKKKRQQKEKDETKMVSDGDQRKEVFSNMVNSEDVTMFSKFSLLDDGQVKLVNEIVEKFAHLGEKSQKQIRKYLIRLITNKKPLKVDRFLEDYNLDSLSDDVILILDDLGIDVIFGSRDDSIQNIDSQTMEEKENLDEEVPLDFEVQKINKKLLGLFMKDPLSAIIEKAKLCGYGIENENLLRKQIEGACKSSKYVKDSLLLSLFKESFSKPILKHSGAYSLRAGGSGYRFVLRQHDEKYFTIVGFYNHDDYEQILDDRNRKW